MNTKKQKKHTMVEIFASGDAHEKTPQFQYYYKTNGCPASTAKDVNCICWYDEGTGLHKNQRHDDEKPLVEWRTKPTAQCRSMALDMLKMEDLTIK